MKVGLGILHWWAAIEITSEESRESEQKSPEAIRMSTLKGECHISNHAWSGGEAKPSTIDAETTSQLIAGKLGWSPEWPHLQ